MPDISNRPDIALQILQQSVNPNPYEAKVYDNPAATSAYSQYLQAITNALGQQAQGAVSTANNTISTFPQYAQNQTALLNSYQNNVAEADRNNAVVDQKGLLPVDFAFKNIKNAITSHQQTRMVDEFLRKQNLAGQVPDAAPPGTKTLPNSFGAGKVDPKTGIINSLDSFANAPSDKAISSSDLLKLTSGMAPKVAGQIINAARFGQAARDKKEAKKEENDAKAESAKQFARSLGIDDSQVNAYTSEAQLVQLAKQQDKRAEKQLQSKLGVQFSSDMGKAVTIDEKQAIITMYSQYPELKDALTAAGRNIAIDLQQDIYGLNRAKARQTRQNAQTRDLNTAADNAREDKKLKLREQQQDFNQAPPTMLPLPPLGGELPPPPPGAKGRVKYYQPKPTPAQKAAGTKKTDGSVKATGEGGQLYVIDKKTGRSVPALDEKGKPLTATPTKPKSALEKLIEQREKGQGQSAAPAKPAVPGGMVPVGGSVGGYKRIK